MESLESLVVDILQNHQIHILDRDGSILLAEHDQLFLFSIYKHQRRTEGNRKLIEEAKANQVIIEILLLASHMKNYLSMLQNHTNIFR